MRLDGWTEYLLGDVAIFKNGLNFTKSDDGEEIKIVGVSDFKNRSQLESTEGLDSIRVATKVRDAELLESGDLLFVRSNGNRELIGRCLYFPQVAQRLAYSGFTIRGRVDRSVIEPAFASYLMRSKLVTDQIFLGGSGTNISNLSQEILANIAIRIPAMPEQRRIARVLSTWDQAIGTTERLLANSRRQKQALMHRLMSPTAATEKSWKTFRLGELFSERNENARDDLPLLSITRDEGVIPRGDVGRKDTSNEDKSKYLRICVGDIGYNTMRMWQGVSALSTIEGIVSPAYTIVTPNDRIGGRFAAYLFKLEKVVFLFYRNSQGLVSDTWNLKFPYFAQISVSIPNVDEQKRIVQVLEMADKSIFSLTVQLEKLREEKAALMAQLLTGKRRVHLPEPETRSAPMHMYPVTLTPDKADGGFVVTFVDIPEAITQGDTLPEAMAAAREALESALDFYLENKRAVPLPSKPKHGQPVVELPASLSAKLQLLQCGV